MMSRRFDLGTADELGLDVLINSLYCFSKECALSRKKNLQGFMKNVHYGYGSVMAYYCPEAGLTFCYLLCAGM